MRTVNVVLQFLCVVRVEQVLDYSRGGSRVRTKGLGVAGMGTVSITVPVSRSRVRSQESLSTA